jgi:hypothetical protein
MVFADICVPAHWRLALIIPTKNILVHVDDIAILE